MDITILAPVVVPAVFAIIIGTTREDTRESSE